MYTFFAQFEMIRPRRGHARRAKSYPGTQTGTDAVLILPAATDEVTQLAAQSDLFDETSEVGVGVLLRAEVKVETRSDQRAQPTFGDKVTL